MLQQTHAGLALLDPRLFQNRLIASDFDRVGYFMGYQPALEWKDSDSALVRTSASQFKDGRANILLSRAFSPYICKNP
jgi:hypothetical protein